MSNQVYSNDIYQYPIDTTQNPSIVTLTGSQTLTNKIINNLTTTGTSSSFNNSKYIVNYISGVTTVGNVTAPIATIPVPTNSQLMIIVNIMSKCTAGPDVNKIRGTSATNVTKNVAGVVTTFTLLSNNAGNVAYAPTISFIPSTTNIVITANGVTANTISYSGTYEQINS